MSASPIVQLSGDDRHGRRPARPTPPSSLADDVAQGHLVEPALAPVRAQDEPVRAVLLEQLDLVALVEVADLGAAQLVGRVEQADDAIADDPALAAIERADEALVEGQARRRRRCRGSDRPCAPGAATAGASEASGPPSPRSGGCLRHRRRGLPRRRRRRPRSGWRQPRRRWPPVPNRDARRGDGHELIRRLVVFAPPAAEQAEGHRGGHGAGRRHQGRREREGREGRAVRPGHGEQRGDRAPWRRMHRYPCRPGRPGCPNRRRSTHRGRRHR